MLQTAMETAAILEAKGISVQIVNARFAAPIDAELLCRCAQITKNRIVTMEEGIHSGGFGEGCLDILAQRGISAETLIIALPEQFIAHGKRESLLKQCGLDAKTVSRQIIEKWFSGGQ